MSLNDSFLQLWCIQIQIQGMEDVELFGPDLSSGRKGAIDDLVTFSNAGTDCNTCIVDYLDGCMCILDG